MKVLFGRPTFGIDNYNVFPKDLHPENLAALLKPQIEQEIMPLVQYQEGCKKPDIVLDKSQIYELQKDPKALIVDVRVRVFDHLAPQTAVLYLTVHRAEVAVRDNFLHMMTISLDLPKETITARVKDFARYEVMTTCKMSQTGSFQ